MKKFFLALLTFLGILIVVLLLNTFRFTSKQVEVSPVELMPVDVNAVTGRLTDVIQLQTLSGRIPRNFLVTPFLQLHQYLEKAFPLVHTTLKKQVINNYSLLYEWSGKNPQKTPIILMAHLDVVPVEPGTESDWNYPPFSGTIAEGFIWGRGALDDKSNVLAQLEAVEQLLQTGFQPEQTIYFAFGHDEEIGGGQGAAKIVDYLESQDIQAAFTLDEGLMIVNGELSPAKKNTGIIGIAEKGYVTLKITAKQEGGHSSVPPPKLTLLTLSQAIDKLVSNQLPASLDGPAGRLFEYLGPEMGFIEKMLFANQWLFSGIITMVLEQRKTTNALIRTTTAPTIIKGGIKENVLPSEAHALVNFRILPGETPQSVMAHAKRVIDDPAIEVTFHGRNDGHPSKVSDFQSPGFTIIAQSIKEVFPDTLVTPGLVVAGTDSKHYQTVAQNNYRFSPFLLAPSDISRFHGTNERISIENYVSMIQFYTQLLRNVARHP